jgi:hypothetical protein
MSARAQAVLLALLVMAATGCTTLTHLADLGEPLPWDCGEPPVSAAAHADTTEAGGENSPP